MVDIGQASLANFYQSVLFNYPSLAADIYDDVFTVSLYGMSMDKSGGIEAAERLHRAAFDMPVIFARVLDGALKDLGYDVA